MLIQLMNSVYVVLLIYVELDAITYSDFNDGEFNMARRKVLKTITECETTGFLQALNALDLNNFGKVNLVYPF